MKRTLHHEYNRNRRPTDDSDSLIIKQKTNYQKEIETAIQSVEKQMGENWVASHRHYEWKISEASRMVEIRNYTIQIKLKYSIGRMLDCKYLFIDELLHFGEDVIYDLVKTSPEVSLQYNLPKRLDNVELQYRIIEASIEKEMQIPHRKYKPKHDKILDAMVAPLYHRVIITEEESHRIRAIFRWMNGNESLQQRLAFSQLTQLDETVATLATESDIRHRLSIARGMSWSLWYYTNLVPRKIAYLLKSNGSTLSCGNRTTFNICDENLFRYINH